MEDKLPWKLWRLTLVGLNVTLVPCRMHREDMSCWMGSGRVVGLVGRDAHGDNGHLG